MKKLFLSSLTMVAATVAGGSAFAQDYNDLIDVPVAAVTYSGSDNAGGGVDGEKGGVDCGKGCGVLDGLGCGIGSTYALFEWTHFAYHRADGSRVGDDATGDDAQADFHASMRYTVGYTFAGGLGIRVRYWEFGHSSASQDAENGNRNPIEGLYTNTYNFDVELFETVELNCNWSLEISGGIRYNDFEELMIDDEGAGNFFARFNASDSFGGVGGLEARRCLSTGSLYFGFRTAILMANDAVRAQANTAGGVTQNVVLQDVPRQQYEIFGGWENDWCFGSGVAYLRIGAEWQHWMNFSSAFDGGNEDVWDGESNVGFGGFVLGAGFIY